MLAQATTDDARQAALSAISAAESQYSTDLSSLNSAAEAAALQTKLVADQQAIQAAALALGNATTANLKTAETNLTAATDQWASDQQALSAATAGVTGSLTTAATAVTTAASTLATISVPGAGTVATPISPTTVAALAPTATVPAATVTSAGSAITPVGAAPVASTQPSWEAQIYLDGRVIAGAISKVLWKELRSIAGPVNSNNPGF
jgi:hypothetical protein